MEVVNAIQMLAAAPDSQYRLLPCGCGNDQPVYLQNEDKLWRVECLSCGSKSGDYAVRHDAQVEWNRGCKL